MPLSLNLGTLTSWNPLGLSGPVMGLLLPNNASKWQMIFNLAFKGLICKKDSIDISNAAVTKYYYFFRFNVPYFT